MKTFQCSDINEKIYIKEYQNTMRFFFPLHFSFQSNLQNIETETQEETPDGNTNSKYEKKIINTIFYRK